MSTAPAAATAQVNRLVPRGTPEARARKIMTDRGFQISRLSSDHATNHLLVCACSGNGIYWQVGLLIIDGKVAATSVTITDTH